MSKLLSKITGKIAARLRKVKALLHLDTEYRFADFSIVLPADHALPIYQKAHRLYDRFLPHLSKYIESGSTVIDVGANCGDTVAAMFAANKNLSYICVEADDYFFRFLQRNVTKMKVADKTASLQALKAFVGKVITDVTLEGSAGTKKAILGGGEHSSRTLDALVLGGEPTAIRLLKSDVDGFDYDVIDLAELILTQHAPMIFFECQLDHDFQKVGYKKTLSRLKGIGYENFFIFDNFGELLFRTTQLADIDQLIEYVWRQNVNRTTRTIYLFDILAATNKDIDMINNVVDAYIGGF